MGAIPICQNNYSQSVSYTGVGTLNELNGMNQGCLTTGESNSVWYILNTSSAGNLVFTITPASNSDYDFAVWDLTDKSCNAIGAGLQPIRCNYASLPNSTPGGLTGLSTTSASASIGAAGGSFSSAINAAAGQTFVILINNSSASTSGYTIDFSGSTCNINDNVSPFIKSDTIAASCTGPTSVKILLSENIICSSFAANGSDFHLSPASASITSASSVSCSGGGSYSNLFTINFSSPLAPGTYTISTALGTDGNTLIDNCGNAMPVGSSISFTVMPPLHVSVATQSGCAGTASGAITATGAGGTSPYSYKLNSGAFVSSNVFSGLYAGTYTITIKDDHGCTDDTVVVLTTSPVIVINSALVTNLTCYGVNTGSVTMNASGGIPPLTYAVGLSPYSSSNTISNLSPGNFIIHIKDAIGCIKDTVVFISSPGQISINSFSLTNATCGSNNGTINIVAFGGAPVLNYSLNSGAYQSSGNFVNLSPGTYTVHVKDANACLKDTIVTLSAIGVVHINSLNLVQPGCAGNSGAITINGGGGTTPYSYSINGTTFTTSNYFAGLSSGTYTVTMKDANGCTSTSSANLISPTNLFFTNTNVVQPTCLIQGSITVHGIGGTAPYQYALGSGSYSTATTFSPLVPGSYVVHIKDQNGCVHDTTIVLTNILTPVITSLTNVNPTCSFPGIGSITVNATGGVPALVYSLNGAPYVNSNVFSSLNGGSYTVTVKDANGCTQSSIVLLNTANTLSFSTLTHTNVGCNGSPLASINAVLGGGNAPYQYSLNGAPFTTSGSYSGLNAGTYTITGKDASGCTLSSLVVINTSATLAVTSVVTTPSPCFNPPIGTITLGATASATPITYSLNYGSAVTSGTFGSLSPGSYTVTIHDANGCHKDSVVNVPGPPSMYYSNSVIVTPPCSGGLGSIFLVGAGGVPSYTYSLDGSPFTPVNSWTNLPAATYHIQIKDANGCLHDTLIDLIEPPPITLSSIVIVNASCSGAAVGSISVTATSGTPPFQYALNSGVFGSVSVFTGLASGTYVIHVKDSHGCGKDSTIFITNTGNFVFNSIVKNQPDCNGGNNGSITMNAGGGTPPYQYALNTGAFSISNTFSGLTANAYTLHAKDNAGCTRDSVVVLTQPTALNYVNIAITPAICFGSPTATVMIGGSGGTPSYQCKLDGGPYFSLAIFNNVTPGTHTVTMKDTKGCLKDSVIHVGQTPPLYFNNVNVVNPGCTGTIGSITLGGTGGTAPYNYAIGSGPYSTSPAFTNLPLGSYTLHIKDNNGCVHDTAITLITSQQIALNNMSSSPFICPNASNGFISVSAYSLFPPVNYSYNGGAVQTTGFFTGLTPGSYSLHVQDQAGCFMDSVIIIQSAPPIQINNIIMTPTLCHTSSDGALQVNAIGGMGSLRYALNGGAFLTTNSFANLTGGSYTIHIKDSLACTKDTSVQVIAPPALHFASINLVQPFCSIATDGKITINANGGTPPYQYTINTSLFTTNNIFQNLVQGTYSIHVKDYNGCVIDSVIQLTAANYMNFINVLVTNVNCKYGNDGSISLGVTGGMNPYTFSINSVSTGMSSFFGNLGAGSYSIKVTDFYGCQQDTVIDVHEPLSPVVATILNVTPNKCRGDSIGTITCSAMGGSSPYQYSIDGSNFQTSAFFGGLVAGIYTITVKDNHACIDDTLTAVIEPDTSVQLFLLGIKDQSCLNVNDGAITVNSKYGYLPLSYYFNGASVGTDTFYNNLTPGNYIVEVKDSMGCKSTGKFVVKPSDRKPYIIIDSIKGILCAGDQDGFIDWHTINTFPPYYYVFDSIYQGTDSYAAGITNGTYLIQVTDSIGCKADTTVTLVEGDQIDLTSTATPALCQGLGDDGKAIAIVDGGKGPFSYTWSGSVGNHSDQATGLWYGEQVVYVEDVLGCVDSSHFVVEYEPCCLVNLPNAFSPNGDSKNDIFKVIKYGYSDIVSFEVYNRWGNRVFSTTSEEVGWDGKYLGTDCELGTYFYLLRYRCHLKNETLLLKGDVTLLR